jgi:hypothetical protein
MLKDKRLESQIILDFFESKKTKERKQDNQYRLRSPNPEERRT